MKKYTILKIIFVLLMIVGLFGLLWWKSDKKEIEKQIEHVSEYLVLDNDSYVIKEEIKEENEDTVGWLIVEDTNINYPVVQAKNNKYYLNHDYDKKRNSAGWVFMDSNNTLEDQNIIIYGHHRKDKIMFGDIDKLFKKDYYKNHDGEIILVINGENISYEIFSVYVSPSDGDYNLVNYENFSDKLNEFANKSEIKFNKNLEGVTQIITLSTCHKNNVDRLVVHALKKIKEGV